MRTLLLFTCFSFLLLNGYSQNIIPNADWELGPTVSTDYPTGWAVNGPDDWILTNESPDRIYWGSITAFRDNDTAESGLAYVMFYGPFPEAGKCTLNAPLVAGTLYHLTYYLDVDENFDGGPGGICFNFIGSDSIFSPYVDNTGVWQYFDTTFTASASCNELKLVAFGANLTKIDNIQLTNPKNQAVPVTQQNKMEVTILPNPFTSSAVISFHKTSVQNGHEFDFVLCNIFGKEERRINGIRDGQMIKRGNLESGIYFFRILDSTSVISTGKIVVQ